MRLLSYGVLDQATLSQIPWFSGLAGASYITCANLETILAAPLHHLI